jgi:hypothetical protein
MNWRWSAMCRSKSSAYGSGVLIWTGSNVEQPLLRGFMRRACSISRNRSPGSASARDNRHVSQGIPIYDAVGAGQCWCKAAGAEPAQADLQGLWP